ncbi:flagellar hook-length control protein FliK [Paracoccus sp. ME4]|uniref:flagellar hook-length control protein FliK n=1 Tax=Paracoccus sp. ME4 TaxID=3138066 RepID=UPI00398B1650
MVGHIRAEKVVEPSRSPPGFGFSARTRETAVDFSAKTGSRVVLGLGLPMDLGMAPKAGTGSMPPARNAPAEPGGSVFEKLLTGAGRTPHEYGSSQDPVGADAEGAPDEAALQEIPGPHLDPPEAGQARNEAGMAAEESAVLRGAAAGSFEPAATEVRAAATEVRAAVTKVRGAEPESPAGMPESPAGMPETGRSAPSCPPATSWTPSGNAGSVQADAARPESEVTAQQARESHAVAMAEQFPIRTPAPRNSQDIPTGSLEVPGLKTARLVTGERVDPLRAAPDGPVMGMGGQDIPESPGSISAMSVAVEEGGPGRRVIAGHERSGPNAGDLSSSIGEAPGPVRLEARHAQSEAGNDMMIEAPSGMDPALPGKPARLVDARGQDADVPRDAGSEVRAVSRPAAPVGADAAQTFIATGFEDAEGAIQRLGYDLAAVAEQSARTARTASGRFARTDHQLLGNVGAALRLATVDETGKTTLTLRPQGLGLIEIEISKDHENRVHMSMRVQNPMVLDAIQSDRLLISGMLENGGRGLSGFDLSGFDQGARDRSPDRGAPAGPGAQAGPGAEASPQEAAVAAPADTRTAPGGVDILI